MLSLLFYTTVVTLLNPSWRNRFRKCQLTSMVALGLRRPYAKTKVGESCTCLMLIDLADGYYWDQNTLSQGKKKKGDEVVDDEMMMIR